MTNAIEEAREALDLVLQNCEASASTHAERIEVIHRVASRALAALSGERETLQARVKPWMDACFGPEISADRLERNDRFIEEALELVQASNYPKERALALVDYVYGRDQGEINQEVGGVMITLAAHCLAHGVDMHQAGETELARIWTKVDQIRAKQAAKPTGSALPVAALSAPTPSENNVTTLTTPEGVTFSKYATLGPSVSGLTEEERADQALFIDLLKTLDVTDEYYRADFVAMNLPQIIAIMQRYAYAESLSPAPSIDWKRVAEVRARHERDAANPGIHSDGRALRSAQAEADRAFLLSLLPKQEANDGQ